MTDFSFFGEFHFSFNHLYLFVLSHFSIIYNIFVLYLILPLLPNWNCRAQKSTERKVGQRVVQDRERIRSTKCFLQEMCLTNICQNIFRYTVFGM